MENNEFRRKIEKREEENPKNIETACDTCGKSISLYEHSKNKGLCNDCIRSIQ